MISTSEGRVASVSVKVTVIVEESVADGGVIATDVGIICGATRSRMIFCMEKVVEAYPYSSRNRTNTGRLQELRAAMGAEDPSSMHGSAGTWYSRSHGTIWRDHRASSA